MNYLVIKTEEDDIDLIIVSEMSIEDMIVYVEKQEKNYDDNNDGFAWFGDYLRHNLLPSMSFIDTANIGDYIVYY